MFLAVAISSNLESLKQSLNSMFKNLYDLTLIRYHSNEVNLHC